jgi:DNA-binding IscR family transcriptional regulator
MMVRPASSGDLRTYEALLRLVAANPNRLITRDEVLVELGREVSRNAISKAARRLARSMPIESVRGTAGGYMLLVPVNCNGVARCCRGCAYHGTYGRCEKLGQRTGDQQYCGAWRRKETSEGTP